MLDDLKYKEVSPEQAFAALAKARIVFWADTHHSDITNRLGIVRAVGNFMQHSNCRDLCFEVSPQELDMCSPHANALFARHGTAVAALAELGDRLEALRCKPKVVERDEAVTALSALAFLGLGRHFAACIHGVDVDYARKAELLRQLDLPVAQRGLFHAGRVLWTRRNMDPEIAAHIWYATRQRPTSVVFGAEHLRDGGIPSHFDAKTQATVAVFSDLVATKNRAREEQRSVVPTLKENLSHIYLAREDVWLKTGRWFGMPLAKVDALIPDSRKTPQGLHFGG